MKDIKKNRPGDCGTRTAAEMAAFGRAAISSLDYTAPTARRQVPKARVSDFLGVGARNGKTLKQLREIFPGDGRSIRAQIERERRDTPILSGQTGYFLPEREDEIRRFCASMRHRARRVWATASNVEKAAGLTRYDSQQLDGQGCIWDGGDSDG